MLDNKLRQRKTDLLLRARVFNPFHEPWQHLLHHWKESIGVRLQQPANVFRTSEHTECFREHTWKIARGI